MKTRHILIIAMLIGFTGCEDYLDRKNLDSLDDSNFWTNEGNMRLYAQGAYTNYFYGYGSGFAYGDFFTFGPWSDEYTSSAIWTQNTATSGMGGLGIGVLAEEDHFFVSAQISGRKHSPVIIGDLVFTSLDDLLRGPPGLLKHCRRSRLINVVIFHIGTKVKEVARHKCKYHVAVDLKSAIINPYVFRCILKVLQDL